MRVESVKVIDLKPDAEMLKEVREYFPHRDVRRYQADLANSVYEALLAGEKNIVVEAPTGLGKGPDAVSPTLPRLPRAGPRRGP
jgi:Rad3-related DNA helicase